jgi:hypothetical protein
MLPNPAAMLDNHTSGSIVDLHMKTEKGGELCIQKNGKKILRIGGRGGTEQNSSILWRINK